MTTRCPLGAPSFRARLGNGSNPALTVVTVCGKILYPDELQVLVKWDDGSSSSLRVDKGELREVRPLNRSGAR